MGLCLALATVAHPPGAGEPEAPLPVRRIDQERRSRTR